MRNPLILGCVAAAALAAGCGSSSSSSTTTNTTSASAPATTATQAASKSAYGATTGTSSTPNAGSATGTAITVKHSKFGTILAAGPKRLTVYLFEGDKGGKSACSGACAVAWPPVTTGGRPQVSGAANASQLGTITRSNGTMQVTYNGHPLYFFVKDKDDGDAYGQGVSAFGADWYVMAPSGNKIDTDASHSGGGPNAS